MMQSFTFRIHVLSSFQREGRMEAERAKSNQMGLIACIAYVTGKGFQLFP